AFWRLSGYLDLQRRPVFIRLQQVNSMEWFRKFPSLKRPHSIRGHLMLWLSSMLTGSVYTTGKHTTCMHVTESCSITSLQSEVKLFLPVRSQGLFLVLHLDYRKSYIWVIFL